MVKKREWRECVVLGKKEFVFEKKILFTAGKEKKRYIYIYIYRGPLFKKPANEKKEEK